MQKIGAFAAKTHFSALLERVERGEEVVITKRGNPVARLIGFNNHQHDKKQAIASLMTFAENNHLNGLDWKSLRDEGKR